MQDNDISPIELNTSILRKRAIRLFLEHPDVLVRPRKIDTPSSIPPPITQTIQESLSHDSSINSSQSAIDEETDNGSIEPAYVPCSKIVIPIDNDEFQFNKTRNVKEMAMWWIAHPPAHQWRKLLLGKKHKFPGEDLPMDKCNTYKRLHNYTTLGEYLQYVGADRFDDLLLVTGTTSYHQLKDALKLVRSTGEHRIIKARNAAERANDTLQRNLARDADLRAKKLEAIRENEMIVRPSRRRLKNVHDAVQSLTSRAIAGSNISNLVDDFNIATHRFFEDH